MMISPAAIFRAISRASESRLLVFGFLLRLILVAYSVWHDSVFRVKYTDVDYLVVNDAARHMVAGGSPFDRETYRYTPLLAMLLVPNIVFHNDHIGKLFLCVLDVLAARFCMQIMRRFATPAVAKRLVSMCILFNPIVINVSTRGNSDMIVAFLCLAMLAAFFDRRYILAGLWCGLAIHFRIYPVIYTSALAMSLLQKEWTRPTREALSWTKRGGLVVAQLIMAALATCVGAAIPTLLCYRWYGEAYLHEAILYHVGRIDHRHNLSPYFYPLYLGFAQQQVPGLVAPSGVDAKYVAFLPQMIAVVAAAVLLRRNAAQAIAVQTVAFVTFNKVCTVQYFVWYLPFLPLVLSQLWEVRADDKNDREAIAWREQAEQFQLVGAVLAAFWAMALGTWMFLGKGLEFDGVDYYFELWLASLLFMLAHVMLACYFCRVAVWSQRKPFRLHVE